MLSSLKSFLAPYWFSIAKWGAIGGSVLAVVLTVRNSGKDAVIADQQKKTAQNREIANETERNINRLDDHAVRERLRKRWQRD